MKTLERQLADYGERQRELHGPISPDELTVTLGQSDQKAPLPPHRRRGLWIAVTSAAATLVVFGLMSLLVNTDTPFIGGRHRRRPYNSFCCANCTVIGCEVNHPER